MNRVNHFDLVIIGTGSGNTIPGPQFADWSIAIVEDGLFGGTCTNVGCIPTKMFVYPADLADGVRHGTGLNIALRLDRVDWAGMRDRIFGRIDKIEAAGRRYRMGEKNPNVTVFEGRGDFVGSKRLRIRLHSGQTTEITGERFVIAAGSSADMPDVPGLRDGAVKVHTSDTVMRIDDLPERIAILGSGYIAAEFGHIFSSFGSEVTQICRGPRLLTHHDRDISDAFTVAAQQRYRVILDTTVTAAKPAADGAISLELQDGSRIEVDLLLVCVGRTPNGPGLSVESTGVELDAQDRVVVDEYQRTRVQGIYALGDVSTHWPLKHVANHEARIVAHNLEHPDAPIKADHRYVPAAVFTDPQIASVGKTEQELIDSGTPYVMKKQMYRDIAAGWAREDTTNFLKVLADPATGLLLGAHVIGPEAATVIQPIIHAMHFGQRAHDVARGQYWIHPALSELVENALLGLPDPTG